MKMSKKAKLKPCISKKTKCLFTSDAKGKRALCSVAILTKAFSLSKKFNRKRGHLPRRCPPC